MVAASRGDRVALGEIFDRHGGLVQAIALRVLRSPRDAEDLVHDVFLEVWRDAALYDPARGSVRAWLAVRARSRALDRVGRAEAGRVQALDALGGLADRADTTTPHPVDALSIRRALRVIPEDLRVVLEQKYVLGWTAAESATHLSVPVGTVKSRLARGLALLAQAIDDGVNDER
jgi:RNA polymerase sigma-70 factor (ECF subfamily)